VTWDSRGRVSCSLGASGHWEAGEHIWTTDIGTWRRSLGAMLKRNEKNCRPLIRYRYSLRCDGECVCDSHWDASGDEGWGVMPNERDGLFASCWVQVTTGRR
jgi:hypothetical protein